MNNEDNKVSQPVKPRKRKHRRLTGEDIDMFNERRHEQKSNDEVPICDRHIDGA